MTDGEIIEALHCCIKNEKCDKCPMYKDLFAVECTICGDFISGFRTEEKAIEAWNRRSDGK